MCELGADAGVMSSLAANASSGLSISWSSASGSSTVLKMASSLLCCSVQDLTVLCKLIPGTLLRREQVSRLFEERSGSKIAEKSSPPMCLVSMSSSACE